VERAGLSERAVSDLERSLKHPQRATIHLLSDALRLAHEEAEAFELTARSQSAAPEQKQAWHASHGDLTTAELAELVWLIDDCERRRCLWRMA
jgi:transcriptional regulator with XRE-family HTH domain